MHTIASLRLFASQGESAFMLAKIELKPRAIAIFPFSAVALVGACEAGFGTTEGALAFAGEGCGDCWLLL